MKYSNTLIGLCTLVYLIASSYTVAFSQCDTKCTVACSGQINLSLGTNCEAEITPWMGGKSIAVGDPCYAVEVFDAHNKLIPNNIVDISYLNQRLTYKVIELECNNHCWGHVLVEYKAGPQIICPPDMTIECGALDFLDIPIPDDLCAAVSINLLNEKKEKLECDPDFTAVVTRTYRAVDEYGNSNSCSHDIYLERVTVDDILLPESTTLKCSDSHIVYDVNGFPKPWYYHAQADTNTVVSLPILCTGTVTTDYICPTSFGDASINSCNAIISSLNEIGLDSISVELATSDLDLPCSINNYFLSFSNIDNGIGSMNVNCLDASTVPGISNYTVYLWDGGMLEDSCSSTVQVLDPLVTCVAGGTGSGTGSGSPSAAFVLPYNLGSGNCSYGLPIFPDGGGVVYIETGDTDNPISTTHFEEENNAYLCGAVVLYSDIEIPTKNTCKRKIMRTWEVYEWWCAEEFYVNSVQTIEILDDNAPVLNCPSNLTISTNADCASNVDLLPVQAIDECGSDLTVRIDYPEGHMDSNGGVATMLPGNNIITYTVTDACNNSASCQIAYTIIDYTSPVAICENRKVISLGSGSYTQVPAQVFDNGSYDDCSIEHMYVRRADDTCHPDNTTWAEYTKFCCADAITGEALVEFRVIDYSGNYSDCIVTVEIQDKANPIINCPSDRNIDCTDLYDINNLGLSFGYATISDNCATQVPVEILDSELNQCGVGLLTRTLQVLDPDNQVVASCKQLITITNASPFLATDITWPADYQVYDICDVNQLAPEFLEAPYDKPTYAAGSEKCALLGYDYEDKVYTADPTTGECAVIQRIWTVINWCADNNTHSTYVNPIPQLIKIKNSKAPQMDVASDLYFEGQNVDCKAGQVDVIRTATDDCENALIWDYTLKTFPEGSIVQKGNTNTISGKYPVGHYTIEWRVFDGCGNFDYHVQSMSVQSNKAPTPVCHNGLSATLIGWDTNGDGIEDTQKIDLWASDFNAGSYPRCDNPITFSFSDDTTDTNIIFDCNRLGRNSVNLYVTDVVTGAQDFCTGYIDIQDNGACPVMQRVIVDGRIWTEMSQEISGVQVVMDNNINHEVTDATGTYAFGNMPMGGSYEVVPTMDEDYLNGVSTLDLILIQRHILGIEALDSPYKMIAADINSSESINGIDLIELRKLVLGIYTDLPENDSWRFVSKDYQFVNMLNPWANDFEESYFISSLDEDVHADFTGVKIGDVNNSAELGLLSPDNGKVAGHMNFVFDGVTAGLNEVVSVKVTADNYSMIRGWQTTIEFDSEIVEILDVQSDVLNVDTEVHTNLNNQEKGWLTISVNTESALNLSNEDIVFELIVKTKSQIQSETAMFSLSSNVTRSEAYTDAFESIDLINKGQGSDLAEIISVTPNPFVNEASLQYYLPQSEKVIFEYFDISGQNLLRQEVIGITGYNSLQVNRAELNTTGFIYVRMTTGAYISEYKMILI